MESLPSQKPSSSFPTNNHEKERFKKHAKTNLLLLFIPSPFLSIQKLAFLSLKTRSVFLLLRLFSLRPLLLALLLLRLLSLYRLLSTLPRKTTFFSNAGLSFFRTPSARLIALFHSRFSASFYHSTVHPCEPVPPSSLSASSDTPDSSALGAAACGCPCEPSDADLCPPPPFPSACRTECYHRS